MAPRKNVFKNTDKDEVCTSSMYIFVLNETIDKLSYERNFPVH